VFSTPKAVGAVTLTFSLLAAACGGDADGGETRPFGSGERFSIEAALSQIPAEVLDGDEAAFLEIHVADFLGGSDLSGTSRPTGSTDVREIVDWLTAVISGETGVFLPLPLELVPEIATIEDYRNEFGFALTDVDASVQAIVEGQSTLVLVGDLEPKAEVEVAPGVSSYGEGDDFESRLGDTTESRPMGRPVRIAGIDDLVVLSGSTPVASAWVDPGSTRLSADSTLSEMASLLDTREIVAASLFRSDFSRGPASPGEEYDLPISTPFDTFAIGWGVVDGEAVITLVYATGSEDAARTARAEVEAALSLETAGSSGRPIADQLIVKRVDVEGRLVVATIAPRSGDLGPKIVLQLMSLRAAPFVYAS
jgi:hypothetical protein